MIQPPAAHSWPWWAYDLAWSNLQRDNDRRWRAGQELWSTIQPAHYAFLTEGK